MRARGLRRCRWYGGCGPLRMPLPAYDRHDVAATLNAVVLESGCGRVDFRHGAVWGVSLRILFSVWPSRTLSNTGGSGSGSTQIGAKEHHQDAATRSSISGSPSPTTSQAAQLHSCPPAVPGVLAPVAAHAGILSPPESMNGPSAQLAWPAARGRSGTKGLRGPACSD